MQDIVEIADGKDLGLADSPVGKAGNLLSVQIGSLEYAPEFGVDFKFFLQSQFQIQNESFKAYLVERLAFNQINVSEIFEQIESLSEKLIFFVGDAANKNLNGGMIR